MGERKALLQYLEVNTSLRNLYKLLQLLEMTTICFYYAKKLFVILKKENKAWEDSLVTTLCAMDRV